ncbi:MAG: hypothetical protein AAFO91_05695 [Bacteroidota bacterium]
MLYKNFMKAMIEGRIPLLLLFVGLSGLLQAQFVPGQYDDIHGSWEGVLRQNEGGFAELFVITMRLEAQGGRVRGSVYVALEDIEAEMAVEGHKRPNGSWLLRETRILHSRKPDYLEWCMKGFELTVAYDPSGDMILRGPWWGRTKFGPCVPGAVELRKRRERAK